MQNNWKHCHPSWRLPLSSSWNRTTPLQRSFAEMRVLHEALHAARCCVPCCVKLHALLSNLTQSSKTSIHRVVTRSVWLAGVGQIHALLVARCSLHRRSFVIIHTTTSRQLRGSVTDCGRPVVPCRYLPTPRSSTATAHINRCRITAEHFA